MSRIIILFLSLLVVSCNQQPKANNENKTPEITDSITGEITSEEFSDYADYYLVIADTGLNYYDLRNKMLNLQTSSGIAIDTMLRTYDKAKDLIVLTEKTEDEMYIGEYFPRRYPSEFLSLDYLDFYCGTANKTIALVAGIYENKADAEATLSKLKPFENKSFIIKSKVYIGCMH